jgi:hypothetical protein
MKHAHRPFLAALLLTLILVCGVGTSQPIKSASNSMADCAERCKEHYDAAMKRCNEHSGAKAERCQAMAQRHYDNCLERCKGGDAPSPGF